MRCAAVWISVVLCLVSFPLFATEYVPGEVIVKFRTGEGTVSAMAAQGENRPVTLAVGDTRQALSEIQARDDVEYVEPNYIIEAEAIPMDWPYDLAQWSALELPEAWDYLEASGPGGLVTIAVIDSGVELSHPDLQGILEGGYDFAHSDPTPEDDAGHGTRVCGILGALGDNGFGIAGVAWNVDIRIMPLKFMTYENGRTTGSLSDAVDAIYHAVEHGADIINASWGFSSYSYALSDAIAYAQSHGVMFVCSAGNSGEDNDVVNHYPSNYPFDNLIAVAAMNPSGNLARFSNYGMTSVDLVAPGVGLSTTDLGGGYADWVSGTSYATPFVSAVAAMVKSMSPQAGVRELRSILLGSVAAGEGAGLQDIATGGCINAHQALLAEAEYDPSSGSLTPSLASPGENPQSTASGEGSSGGGCLIVSSRNPGSGLLLALLFPLTVLSLMPRERHRG